jgi:hypothetical protein
VPLEHAGKGLSLANADAVLEEIHGVYGTIVGEDIRGISLKGALRDMALCDRATYMHLGRKAAMILAPSTPRLFEARLRLVMAL